MNKRKIIIIIVSIVLSLSCVALAALISGRLNNGKADNPTTVPSESSGQTDVTQNATVSKDTTDSTDATGTFDEPTVGVEVGVGKPGNSGGSGNGGSSNNDKFEIDFDDLLNKGDKDEKPTTPKPTTPETTPETTPATTEPDSGDDEQGGETPEDTDIDVPLT